MKPPSCSVCTWEMLNCASSKLFIHLQRGVPCGTGVGLMDCDQSMGGMINRLLHARALTALR